MFTKPAAFRPIPRILAVALLLAACSDRTPSGPAAVRSFQANAASTIVPGRLLVGVQPGTDAAALAATHGAVPLRELLLRGIWLMRVPEGREHEIAGALARNPAVRFAEPDYIRVFDDVQCTSCQIPNDFFFEYKWDLHNDGDVQVAPPFFVMPTGKVDADIDWLEAHEQLRTTTVGSAAIGIVDSGIRASHEDLCGKVIAGHDFANNDDDPADDHGHGTHVAGIAAACADNELGGAGVAFPPSVKIIAAKACTADGNCTSSAIIDGIKWVVDQGAQVVNLSLGGPDASTAERDALVYALAHGALPVCAAGNEGGPAVLYPAAFPECLAVSSTNWGDGLASYSSYGPEVDVAAPGGDMEDFLFGSSFILSAFNTSDGDYNYLIGTSMAAPQVSGLAGLLRALNPGATPATIRARIEQTVDDLGAPGKDNLYGYGRINVYKAVNGSTNPPPGNSPPTASFTASCTGLTCSFNASASTDLDGTIDSYAWQFGDGASAAGVTTSHAYAAGGTYTVGLTVTDDDGATGSSTKNVTVSTPSTISLTATGYLERRKKRADLVWTGATSTQVDVLRNGVKITTTANDGFYSDAISGKGKTFTYKVCEAGTATCSNEATVSF